MTASRNITAHLYLAVLLLVEVSKQLSHLTAERVVLLMPLPVAGGKKIATSCPNVLISNQNPR